MWNAGIPTSPQDDFYALKSVVYSWQDYLSSCQKPQSPPPFPIKAFAYKEQVL